MKFRRIGIPILIGLFFCLTPHDAYGGADTKWAEQKKFLIGDFNNWTPSQMTGPDSNGLYRISVRAFAGAKLQYKFGAVINGVDTQTEPNFTTPSKNREFTVPTGADTIYVPTNWSDTPPKPQVVQVEIVGDGQVRLTWTETSPGGLDVLYGGGFNVYYNSPNPGPPWTKANGALITTTSYVVTGLSVDNVYHFIVTAVDAYDTPGPQTDTSASVVVLPTGKILVQFVIDMRQEIAKSGKPAYGMAVAGDRGPLTWEPFRQPLKEISKGVYGETFLMQSGQRLEYKYVKNPGTSKQEWEGDNKQARRLFRFDATKAGLTGVTAVYVRGTFNGWSDKPEWRLYPDTKDGIYRLVKTLPAAGQEFKYYVYHSADGGDDARRFFPSGGNLSGDVSFLTYTPWLWTDTSVVKVRLIGEFDPYTPNKWQSDDFYSLTKVFSDNYSALWMGFWNLPIGLYYHDFDVDRTNDNVDNGSRKYGSGNDTQVEITRNRIVYLQSNAGLNSMRVKDVWQSEFSPMRAPVSVTALSDSGQVRLSWRKPTDVRLVGYKIYKDTDPKGKFTDTITIVSDTVTEYVDTNVVNGKTYYYKIASLIQFTYVNFTDTWSGPLSDNQLAMPDTAGPTARRMADGQDQSLSVKFQPGSLPADASIDISSLKDMYQDQAMDAEFSEMMAKVQEADNSQKFNPLSLPMSDNSSGDTDSLVYMIDVKSKTTGKDLKFDKAVTLTIPYTAAQMAQATASGQVIKKMAIFVLNETTNRWEILTSSVEDPLKQVLSAPRFGFSTFQVMALAGAPNNLDGMVVFPNPVYVNRDFTQRGNPYGDGRAGATFINIPTDVEFIKIYTITGELVRTLDPLDAREFVSTGASAIMIWDLNNDAGRAVASGVYIFYAKSGTSERRGKVAVIR